MNYFPSFTFFCVWNSPQCQNDELLLFFLGKWLFHLNAGFKMKNNAFCNQLLIIYPTEYGAREIIPKSFMFDYRMQDETN